MSSRLSLHCGFPKTATTTLQFHVFPRLTGISYIGKHFVRYGNDLREASQTELESCLYRLFRCVESDQFDPDGPELERAKLLYSDWSRTNGNAFASFEEVIAGALIPRLNENYEPSPCPDIRSYLSRICSSVCHISGEIPNILITLRDQSSLLQSLYAQAYRDHFCKIDTMRTFSGYLNELFCSHPDSVLDSRVLDYCHLEDVCCDVFGRDNITFLSFEWLKSNPDLFSTRLSAFLGISQPAVHEAIVAAPHENVRRTKAYNGFHRADRTDLFLYATLLKKQLLPDVRLGMGSVAYRLLSPIKVGRTRIKASDEEVSIIRRYFHDSNTDFIHRHPEFQSVLV